ncbi:helix-turn-helix domain-containing protein [Bilifractor sp. LCP21S3_A7]|uniref:helix-turn-helix domain-containing protein n=1 Tax=Bilifractor sp. LCP21S3_A7 TaxID=3438738 RepID=UPI003F934936
MRHLTFADRKKIEAYIHDGCLPREIAEKTGFHIATIYRELQRGIKGENFNTYSAEYAEKMKLR